MAEARTALPSAPRWILRRLCDARYRDIAEHDVAELFALRAPTAGRWRATWLACRDALSVARSDFVRPTLNSRKRQENLMHFARDLRHAGRALVRTPAFTLVVLVTLALAIGANTVIFSVVDGVVLSPLPYDEPDALVVVQQTGDGLGDEDGPSGASQDLFLAWRESGRSFENLAMYSLQSATMTSLDEPVRMNGVAVSPAFFGVLRAEPARGRAFAPDAEQPGQDDGVILSNRAWQRYFGGDPDIVGSNLQFDSRLRVVLGVMPPGFSYPDAEIDYWVPMLATPPESMAVSIGADETPGDSEAQGQQQVTRRQGQAGPGGPGGPDGGGPEGGGPGPEEHMELWGRVIGRLAAGVTPAMAAEEGTTYATGLYTTDLDGVSRAVEVTPLQEQMVGSVRGPLIMLMGAVGFVLLIACANIANLVLARSVERTKETAVRAAIGAGWSNLVRYTLAESVLLTASGGLLGVFLAAIGLSGIRAIGPDFIPRLEEVSIDPRVLAFTLTVTALTAIVFGLLPARSAAKLDLNRALKEDGGQGGLGRSGFRRLLVTAEIALAVVLLVGAGLLVTSFIKLTSVDLGFDAENLLHLNISLPATVYPDGNAHLDFYDQLVERLEALPGVTSATVANRAPYAAANVRVGISAQSRDEAEGPEQRPVPVGVRMVEPGYFETLRVEPAEGRILNSDDRTETQPVAVLSAAGAAAMFGDENPVGEQMDFIGGQRLEIVGIVDDARTAGVDPTPQADIFLPYRQAPARMVPMLFRTAEVLIRTGPAPLGVLPDVRSVLRDLDRQVLVLTASTVRDQVADSVAEPRFYATLVAAFALLSLTLAAVGIYGMLAYMVQQGVRDTAIRRALGAPVGQILSRVFREGLALAIAGLVIGIGGSLFLTRLLESMLYEVEPNDPTSLAAVTLVFLAVAALAVWIPARRATRVDPMEVLRSE